MNLPNYINFDPFNKLRRQMHAQSLGKFDINAARKPAEPKTRRKKAASKTETNG